MNSDFFSDLAIMETVQEEFSKKLEITRMLVREVQVSPTAHASVFRVKGGGVYVLIRSINTLSLGDVQKIVRNMGIEADSFIPPNGVEAYFTDKAMEKYKSVFPGKPIKNDAEELRYYRTLVPYHPALIRVARISSEIREYDVQSRQWNAVKRLSYSKITAQD